MALKWGIVSVGYISHDFVNALSTLDVNDHQVIAVAARNLDRAEKFAERFDIPKFYGNYLELAQDPDIEVVYIGALHIQHFNISMQMLQHGKHVLCEKPLCMNEKEVRRLTAYANEKRLFLMEGLWSRCFPAYQYIRNQIESGKLGEIKSIEIDMGNPNTPNIEHKLKKSLGGGAILNTGVYPIQFCQWIMQRQPQSIHILNSHINDDGIDVETSAEMVYGNTVARIKVGFINKLSYRAKIIGTNGGEFTIPRFSAPTSVINVDKTEKNWPLPKNRPAKYDYNFERSPGFIYEADEVRKCIRAGKIESELIKHNDSILIAHIQDEMRKQIGVMYPGYDD